MRYGVPKFLAWPCSDLGLWPSKPNKLIYRFSYVVSQSLVKFHPLVHENELKKLFLDARRNMHACTHRKTTQKHNPKLAAGVKLFGCAWFDVRLCWKPSRPSPTWTRICQSRKSRYRPMRNEFSSTRELARPQHCRWERWCICRRLAANISMPPHKSLWFCYHPYYAARTTCFNDFLVYC